MFAKRKAAKRFTLLLLEDEEERRFLDFPLCFFTFLNYASFTFSF
jgi:hypothetical protein